MKTELRKKYKTIRNNIEDKSYKDEMIYKSLFNSAFWMDAKSVLLYYSIGSEIDTLKIINRAFADAKKVSLPLCLDLEGHMAFYYINSLDDLIEGSYNIMEPNPHISRRVINFQKSICLVPGLAFSKNKYRLGYGKGYYDRFLEEYKGTSIGLCYEELMIDDLPIDSFDKKMDLIITNKRFY